LPTCKDRRFERDRWRAAGQFLLRTGQKFIITTAKILGDSTRVNTVFTPAARKFTAATAFAFGRVDRIARGKSQRPNVICEVVNGGALGEHKGINLPGVKLRVPALRQRPRRLGFRAETRRGLHCREFVRRPEDVLLAKQLIRRAGRDVR